MKINDLREKAMEKIGEASMCWSEIPNGIFDSEKAVQIGNAILQLIQKEKAEAVGMVVGAVEKERVEHDCKCWEGRNMLEAARQAADEVLGE